MNAALVTPITLETTDIDREAWLVEAGLSIYDPALGVLTLASVLRQAGIDPVVFDLNGFARELYLSSIPEDFVRATAPYIAALDTELFGFGTICGSYPLTIRIVEELKRQRPDAKVILGGPHVSVTDVATLEAFPFVDYVIRGEAEEILVPALEQIASGEPISVGGVTYRYGGRIVRNPNASPVLDLDKLPPPAFEFSKSVECCQSMSIEAGRGCPFSCTFCSTNDFFRRRFRLRSPRRVLQEMDRLHNLYGITSFNLVHDMFTVDRSRVEEFCHAFIAHNHRYTWTCSARTDFVDRALLELMAAAGCKGLFFGIETGSPRLQKIIDKELDIAEASAIVESMGTCGLRCTVSLIVGFPEEMVEDVAATAAFALDSARFDGVRVQINLLAALPATPLFARYQEELFFDGIYSDMSHQTWEQNEDDCVLIKKHRDVFSNFYGLPSGAGRAYVSEFRHFITYGLNRCRWLMIALGDMDPGLTNIFNSWIEWRGENCCRARYYGTAQFPIDFCRFLQKHYRNLQPSNAVSLFLSYYKTLYEVALNQVPPDSIEMATDLPLWLPSVRLAKFPFRLSSAIEAVRHRQKLPTSSLEETTVAFVPVGNGRVESSELPSLGAALLQLCDGRTTISEIARALAPSCQGLIDFSVEELISGGLVLLCEQGLVHFQGTEVNRSP